MCVLASVAICQWQSRVACLKCGSNEPSQEVRHEIYPYDRYLLLVIVMGRWRDIRKTSCQNPVLMTKNINKQKTEIVLNIPPKCFISI